LRVRVFCCEATSLSQKVRRRCVSGACCHAFIAILWIDFDRPSDWKDMVVPINRSGIRAAHTMGARMAGQKIATRVTREAG